MTRNPRSVLWLYLLLLLAGCATPPQPPEFPEHPAMDTAQQRLAAWRQLVHDNQESATDQKLERVNRFFNQLEFVDDRIHWGQEDYWATPEETLTSNGGDCEDFTIAKYFTLKELAVPEQTMRLIYVKSLTLRQPHMVLGYYASPEVEPLVLDNLVDSIVPSAQRPDLVPVYSFNGEGLWLSKQRGQGQRVGGSDQLGRWRQLLKRMGAAASGPHAARNQVKAH